MLPVTKYINALTVITPFLSLVKQTIRQELCTFSFVVIALEHSSCPYSSSFRPSLLLSEKKQAIAVISLTPTSETSKRTENPRPRHAQQDYGVSPCLSKVWAS